MTMGVWDGRRPRTPRTVLASSTISVGGIEFAFVTEQIAGPTEWSVRHPHHTIVVHRAGRLRSLEVEFDNGPSCRTLPAVGDIWIIPSGCGYAALAQGSTVDFCEVRVPPGILGERRLEPAIKQRDPLIFQLIERMSTLTTRDDVFARMLSESMVETFRLQFLEHFVATAEVSPVRPAEMDRVMKARLVEYLEDSLDSDISLAAMARHADMSVSTFSKAFAAAFKTTPHQYLLDRRIRRAKTLLATTTMSVTEISVSVGFSTPSHFATTFKNRVGLAPSALRRHDRGSR